MNQTPALPFNAIFFGHYLLQAGIISEAQLQEALVFQEQHNQLLGELALARDYMTVEQVRETAAEQKIMDLPFGVIALRKAYLSPKQLDDLLFSQVVATTHIGEALVELGHLPAMELSRLLQTFNLNELERNHEIQTQLHALPQSVVVTAGIEALHRAFLRFTHSPMNIVAVNSPSTMTLSWTFLVWLETVDGSWLAMTTSLSEHNALKIAAKLAVSEADVHCGLRCQGRNRLFFTIVKRYWIQLLKKQGIQVAKAGICKGGITASPRHSKATSPEPTGDVRIQLVSPVGPVTARFFLSGWSQPDAGACPEVNRLLS
ncbi:hypothetical protein [Desulfonatronum thioautotrophicum]|uniref:hypothetical protein n=1 Tax=Desulfonatronum thioautotrophicum TaxID=617001 RepID=UPI000A4B0A0E|nr:hypothetical protein [Desulfonatronum thioautotrophicum]